MMITDTAFFSEQGPREVNQDAICVSVEENRGIFAVADGMGGHFGGEVASSAIVNGIRSWWESIDTASPGTDIDTVSEQCIGLLTNLNAEVFSCFSSKGQMGGSTVAVLIIWDDRFTVLSAGDSRIYRVRGRKLEQLTTDDVWENLPEVKYKMNSEAAADDSRFGRLTEALGSGERLKISRKSGILSERETFLLCSDGVYKYCGHSELEKIMCGGRVCGSAERKKRMIRKCVVKGGGNDNYSAVIYCIRR
ncbi:MAG: serine/threonine-protein phosphatase [Butyrivibrio sp.]|nr:serine/threonine-protein phosphatase [Acetatifactor muris]MCM1558524.1 serine/threonine-protein phosphatase [Butyrivibrio sp.]